MWIDEEERMRRPHDLAQVVELGDEEHEAKVGSKKEGFGMKGVSALGLACMYLVVRVVSFESGEEGKEEDLRCLGLDSTHVYIFRSAKLIVV